MSAITASRPVGTHTGPRLTIAGPHSSRPHDSLNRHRWRPGRPDHLDSGATASPVRGARDDADRALRALYAEHGRVLLGYAERFTGDRGRAEDIVQETFLRAWRRLPGLLDDERPVRAWLLRVTRRLLIDADRAARARPMLTDGTPGTEPAVDGGLEQLLDHSMLAEAMQQLSPAHQQIVIETFFHGTPVHLTAARLGVPAGTARSRLHYALDQMRRHLDITLDTVDGCQQRAG